MLAAFAALVFFTRPGRAQNRWLAAFTFGLAAHLAGYGLVRAMTGPDDALAMALAASLPVFWLQAAFFFFMATLPTPFVAPLRTRAARAAFVLYAVALTGWLLWSPTAFQSGVTAGTGALWTNVPGNAWLVPDLLGILGGTFSIVATVSAYRRSRNRTTRRQMRLFATGLVVNDAVLVATLAYIVAGIARSGAVAFGEWFLWIFLGNALWLVGWLSYGILSAQLFDIDLKIKWTISRGTVAAAFIAVFFVVSEGAQQFFAGTRLGPWLGLAAAGLLVFALAPLQRMADRLSDRAMPHVRDTHAYKEGRKREIYRAAVDAALQDGVVTEKERDVLATLADQLGLKAGEARAIERDAAGAPSAGAA